jgi:Predicted flavoprotein involved in K+ transport
MNFHATVAVIGAGQAGLSAAYHLARRDFVSALGNPSASQGGEESSPGSFIVFDAEESAGGAWRHRQESLTMATVNGIFGLPGMEQSEIKKLRPRVRQSRTTSRTMKPKWTCPSFAQFLSLALMRLGMAIASN